MTTDTTGQSTARSTAPRAEATGPDSPPSNRVVLRGKVTKAPQVRELPSGSTIVVLRLSVPREEPTPMVRGSRQSVDWVDCTVWGSRARRSAGRWREGDVVEVEGALRRRFQRSASGPSTRLEVEILAGRIVARGG